MWCATHPSLVLLLKQIEDTLPCHLFDDVGNVNVNDSNDTIQWKTKVLWNLLERFHGNIGARPADILKHMKSNVECQSLIKSLMEKDIRKRTSTVKQNMKAESF